jgi:tripartite-type tricarboxylate transporter receptor subunit TctC
MLIAVLPTADWARAGGNIGMGHPARSTPDGYTVMFVSTSFIVNPDLYPCVPYDDFAPATPNVLDINPSIAATDIVDRDG